MQSEKVRAFKNELRNYNYYKSRIQTLNNSLEFCYDRLGGVRGVDPSKEPIHGMPNKEYEWRIRDEIESYEAKLHVYEAKARWIEQILDRIEEPLRTAVISVYASGKHIDFVANSMYLSANGLAKRMNKAIDKAVD